MSFQSLLENKLDEEYQRRLRVHEDVLVDPPTYQFNMGILHALRNVGKLIQETAQDLNGGKDGKH